MLSLFNFTVYKVFIDCLVIQTTVFGQEDCYLHFFSHSPVINRALFWSEISPEIGKTFSSTHAQ